MKRVYLTAYFENNLGDDLFLHILGNRYPDYEFVTFSDIAQYKNLPNNVITTMTDRDDAVIRFLHKVDYRLRHIRKNISIAQAYIDFKEMQWIKKSEAVVYIIGSGFMEGASVLKSDKYYKKTPYLIGCNFGPFQSTEFYDTCYKHFSTARDVCFRDSYSANLFQKLSNVRWAADVVFNYCGEYRDVLKNVEKKYTLISVMNLEKDKKIAKYKDDYIKFICECVENVIQDGKIAVLVGFCKSEGDHIAVESIKKKVNNSEQVLSFQYPDITIEEVMGLFKYADDIIVTRYHALIIGLLANKKTYSIVYSEKTRHVLEDLDINAPYLDVRDLKQMSADDFMREYGFEMSVMELERVRESARLQFQALDCVLKQKSVESR